jgi:hypothetical protein
MDGDQLVGSSAAHVPTASPYHGIQNSGCTLQRQMPLVIRDTPQCTTPIEERTLSDVRGLFSKLPAFPLTFRQAVTSRHSLTCSKNRRYIPWNIENRT